MKKTHRNLLIVIPAAACFIVLAIVFGMKVTPERLVKEMALGMEEEDSLLCTMDISVTMSDGEDQMEIACKTDVESTEDPEASYIVGRIDMDIAGDGTGIDVERYIVNENDQMISYVRKEDEWIRNVTEEGYTSIGKAVAERMAESDSAFELSEETVMVNGKECYEIYGNISGEVFSGFKDTELLEAVGMGVSVDIEDLEKEEFFCVADIYKDTSLPARIRIDLSESADYLIHSELPSVTVSEYLIEITYLEYGTVDEIIVPDGVLEYEKEKMSEEENSEEAVSNSIVHMDPVEQTGELGSGWESYSVQINDVTVNFPCTVEDIEKAGVKFDLSYTPESVTVVPGGREQVRFKAGKSNFMADLVNPSSETQKIKSCVVYGLYVTSYHIKDENLRILFPGEIEIGVSSDRLKEIYGIPDNIKEGQKLDTWNWAKEESLYYGCVMDIDKEGGKIDGMRIIVTEE